MRSSAGNAWDAVVLDRFGMDKGHSEPSADAFRDVNRGLSLSACEHVWGLFFSVCNGGRNGARV